MIDHVDLKHRHPLHYRLVQVAKAQLGKRYVWGTEGPNTFDCSGLVDYVYLRLGLGFGRLTASMLRRVGKPVHGKLHPGDIITLGDHHVVLYVGNDTVIHAPQSGDVVRYAPVSRYLSRASAVRRIIPWRAGR